MLTLDQIPTPSARNRPLVTTRAQGGVLVLSLVPESLSQPIADELVSVCLGYSEPEMGGRLAQVLCLRMVREVTCDGLRALVQISDSLSAAGGSLIVSGAPQAVRAIVRRTGLSGRLVLARGVREAVRLASRVEEPATGRRARSHAA